MIGKANHSIKQMMVAEGVIGYGENKPLVLDVQMGLEQNNKMLDCVTTEKVIEKPALVTVERQLEKNNWLQINKM